MSQGLLTVRTGVLTVQAHCVGRHIQHLAQCFPVIFWWISFSPKLAMALFLPTFNFNGFFAIVATIDVSPEKRMQLIGLGGHKVRALVAETGAELQTISDESMSIFAPNREVMDDVMKRIETILNEEAEIEVI